MRTSDEERQDFHDAMTESQKIKKNANLNVSAARHIVSDASDDFIDDHPVDAPPTNNATIDVSYATDVPSDPKPATKPASGKKLRPRPSPRNLNYHLAIRSSFSPTRI